jgi:Skp family chaperone for outer membrane proteins
MKKLILFLSFILTFSMIGFAQAKPKAAANPIKTSPAYAEVLLRKVEVESDLEALLLDYKEEYPKVKEAKAKLALLQKELDKLLALNSSEVNRLTVAVGKLIVGKVEEESEFNLLLQTYNDKHPDVIRAKKRVEIFEKAIKELFQ